jgi:hypothetical protein
VALYEALYGERPFAGGSLEDLRRNTRGPVPDPPAGTRVPRRIRRLLLRGLRADPDGRHPSMTALCDALSREPVRVRLWIAGLGAALILGVGALAALASGALGPRHRVVSTPPVTAPTLADPKGATSAVIAPAGMGGGQVGTVSAMASATAAPSATGSVDRRHGDAKRSVPAEGWSASKREAVVPRQRTKSPPPAEVDGIF